MNFKRVFYKSCFFVLSLAVAPVGAMSDNAYVHVPPETLGQIVDSFDRMFPELGFYQSKEYVVKKVNNVWYVRCQNYKQEGKVHAGTERPIQLTWPAVSWQQACKALDRGKATLERKKQEVAQARANTILQGTSYRTAQSALLPASEYINMSISQLEQYINALDLESSKHFLLHHLEELARQARSACFKFSCEKIQGFDQRYVVSIYDEEEVLVDACKALLKDSIRASGYIGQGSTVRHTLRLNSASDAALPPNQTNSDCSLIQSNSQTNLQTAVISIAEKIEPKLRDTSQGPLRYELKWEGEFVSTLYGYREICIYGGQYHDDIVFKSTFSLLDQRLDRDEEGDTQHNDNLVTEIEEETPTTNLNSAGLVGSRVSPRPDQVSTETEQKSPEEKQEKKDEPVVKKPGFPYFKTLALCGMAALTTFVAYKTGYLAKAWSGLKSYAKMVW
ncbi:MAG: hypothetical protein H6679_05890 [Epsilonproteobacteria bacterium]|nr:hypothetical protein [Campylobacterota bacterium]